MNIDFHGALDAYARAETPGKLLAMVSQHEEEVKVNSDDSKRFSEILENFLSSSVNHITQNDFSNLEKVNRLLIKPIVPSKELKNTLVICITLAKCEQKFKEIINLPMKEVSPKTLMIAVKLGLEKAIEQNDKRGVLEVFQAAAEENIREATQNANEEDIRLLVHRLNEYRPSLHQSCSSKESYSYRLYFKGIVNNFFKSASLEKRQIFFSFIKNEKFLSEIMSVLPQSLFSPEKMNSDEELEYYASAIDPGDLINMVLGKQGIKPDDNDIQNFRIILESFLSNRAGSITQNDLPSLMKIKDLIKWLNMYSWPLDKHSKKLEKTLADSIAASRKLAEDATSGSLYLDVTGLEHKS